MMWLQKIMGRRRHEDGQSLLETAVAMPLLLGIAFNLINLGYLWFMVLTMAAAPRQGAQYATQGGQAITTTSVPSAAAVSTLVFDNMTNAVHGATISNTAVRVCMGVSPTTGAANCTSFGDTSIAFSAVAVDPEAPSFALNRVDVGYTVTPLIPGSAFNVVLPPSPLLFRRQVSMRSLY
jgi:Flp pilus assembly protein TadG